ncbi:MAG: biotin transporter BioY [Melioribacteraceae bacterium]|nr:biotin transporter BioY [Melioribacteraceae bacterium]MDD3557349.1 biotin transporter BioY [Melioribacteraceae bacterium]
MHKKVAVKKLPLLGSVSVLTGSSIFWIATFAILTFLAAQLAIPVKPVPFTLQTMLVLLSAAFLGSKNSAISQVTYLTMGVIGLPVFAAFSFGPATLFGPTGGYLLSFPVAAFIVGYLIEKFESKLAVFLSMLLGNTLILLIGSIFLASFFDGNFAEAFISGAAIFSVWGLIKVAAAASIYIVLSKRFPKLPA